MTLTAGRQHPQRQQQTHSHGHCHKGGHDRLLVQIHAGVLQAMVDYHEDTLLHPLYAFVREEQRRQTQAIVGHA